jgi:hypothetical protein
MATGLKYRTKEAVQHRKELKEKSNMPKKANTGSTRLPLPTRYTALLEKESEDQQKAGPENTPKLPPIYITDVTNI